MSNRFFTLAFALGLVVVGWVGTSFVGASWLALAMTAAIAAAYLTGAHELRQFRAATGALGAAVDELAEPPATLAQWLERVPPALRNAVRTRIEGERGGLPGPALTPYLVGLLVMLGMLGTFLGMVVTFKGAVFALQGSTDLQALRAALAEPIKGLGLSFGTSVAGVATSAMLGLMSTISRRERLDVGRRLDARIASVLQPFSLTHQRQETFRALQEQTRALPQVVDALQAMMERIERRSAELDRQLLERQSLFQREASAAYTGLAQDVGASLKDSLAASAKAAGDTIRPVVESAMQRIAQESQRVHERLGAVAQEQVMQLSAQFSAMADGVSRSWASALEQHGELKTLWRSELAQLREDENARGEAAVRRLGELEATVGQHLATLGAALEAPIKRLLQTAAEVPQAAAAVITQLREEMNRIGERDNLALQERTVLLERLGALLQSLQHSAGEQRAAIEAMAAQATGSALELASLGEAFGEGVQLFQASSDKLTDTLQRVETSLTRSTARSDEQLAYYVAQAREVIDLSIASQQGVIENLRQLQAPPEKPLALAAGGRG